MNSIHIPSTLLTLTSTLPRIRLTSFHLSLLGSLPTRPNPVSDPTRFHTHNACPEQIPEYKIRQASLHHRSRDRTEKSAKADDASLKDVIATRLRDKRDGACAEEGRQKEACWICRLIQVGRVGEGVGPELGLMSGMKVTMLLEIKWIGWMWEENGGLTDAISTCLHRRACIQESLLWTLS